MRKKKSKSKLIRRTMKLTEIKREAKYFTIEKNLLSCVQTKQVSVG